MMIEPSSFAIKLLRELVETDNPSQLVIDRSKGCGKKEKAILFGSLKELSNDGYINVLWGDNIPYSIMINDAGIMLIQQIDDTELEENRKDNTNMRISDNPAERRVFISHRSTDKEIAGMLHHFLVCSGIPNAAIFCSSLPGNDNKEKIGSEIREALKNSAINIAILSDEYYKSAYCLNEAGVLWYSDKTVIVIALPEITEDKMIGFLNNDNKIRHLDVEEDIAYIYDAVRKAIGLNSEDIEIVVRETKELITKYKEIIKPRGEIESTPIDISKLGSDDFHLEEINTDDERIVLYYMLHNGIRKVNKADIMNWMIQEEIFDVNINNAFDLLSHIGSGKNEDDTLELDVSVFRKLSFTSKPIINVLLRYVEKHRKLASLTFKNLWENDVFDDIDKLFFAYIKDTNTRSLGTRWMAESMIEDIKSWESKYSTGSVLSSKYPSVLEKLISNRLVYVSSYTSYGNPREYSLYPSLIELLIKEPPAYLQEEIDRVKKYAF